MSSLRLVAFVGVTLVIQVTLVSPITIFGVRGDVMLLATIAVAICGGSDLGAIVGFGAGLAIDFYLNTPLGLSALTYSLVGYLVGSFQSSVLRSSSWIPVASAVVGSAIGVVAYALIGRVLGQATVTAEPLGTIVLAVAVLNGVLARPWVKAARWAVASPSHERTFLR